jgi:hypothetical protein
LVWSLGLSHDGQRSEEDGSPIDWHLSLARLEHRQQFIFEMQPSFLAIFQLVIGRVFCACFYPVNFVINIVVFLK